jgi:hypothetical protein
MGFDPFSESNVFVDFALALWFSSELEGSFQGLAQKHKAPKSQEWTSLPFFSNVRGPARANHANRKEIL